jgi:hypothetical protein
MGVCVYEVARPSIGLHELVSLYGAAHATRTCCAYVAL